MRKLIAIAAVFFLFLAHAATVLWNGVELDKLSLGNGGVDYVLHWCSVYTEIPGVVGYYDLQVRMTIAKSNNINTYRITSYDDDPTATGVTANWLQARAGDIADASTTRNLKYYFNHCHLDHETGWENLDIYSGADSDFYLKFAVGSTDDYNDNILDPECLYGWAHLGIDGNGGMELRGSAIGLEGQSMVVGAIPEPSSAWLLILGIAGLALRRREPYEITPGQ